MCPRCYMQAALQMLPFIGMGGAGLVMARQWIKHSIVALCVRFNPRMARTLSETPASGNGEI